MIVKHKSDYAALKRVLDKNEDHLRSCKQKIAENYKPNENLMSKVVQTDIDYSCQVATLSSQKLSQNRFKRVALTKLENVLNSQNVEKPKMEVPREEFKKLEDSDEFLCQNSHKMKKLDKPSFDKYFIPSCKICRNFITEQFYSCKKCQEPENICIKCAKR